MTVLLETVNDLSLDNYLRVTRGDESVAISESASDYIASRRSDFIGYLSEQREAPIYGVNVGAGDGSFTRLSSDGEDSYTRGLNSATSFGRPLPERVVRGIVFARLSSFLAGTGAVSPELAVHVAGMLDRPLPIVPAEGTRGAGEILPLGHLFSAVPRELDLGPKESMALVNGSPCSAALVADVAGWSRSVVNLATEVLALACDALNASTDHFDDALGDVWGYPEEADALRVLRDLLAHPGSKRNDHQARVSVRIVPRIIAAAVKAVADATTDAEIALRHAGDNPAFVSTEEGTRTLSNGSFHNQRALVAIDNVTRALADLTQLGQHLNHALYQDKVAMPLQDNLSLGISYMVAADWSEEARMHATPSLLSFAAVGQNDVPYPVFAAWRSAVRVQECLLAQLAIVSAMASQSLHTTFRRTTPALAGLLAEVHERFRPIDERRDVGPDLAALTNHFHNIVDTHTPIPAQSSVV